jgi:hypothetical protein
VRDKRLYLLASSVAQGLDPAEVGGVGLDQIGIELMLADDLAAAVVNRTTAIFVVRLRR